MQLINTLSPAIHINDKRIVKAIAYWPSLDQGTGSVWVVGCSTEAVRPIWTGGIDKVGWLKLKKILRWGGQASKNKNEI